MIIFIKIAWRNIVRNKYRSIITIAAVSLGLAALIFIRAFVDGADIQMIKNYTNLLSGQIEIHKQGFQKNMGLERSINNPSEIEVVLNATAGIEAVSKKVKNFVLASSAEQSSGVLLVGIDPVREKNVTELYKHIRKGAFLSGNNDKEIVVGKDLMEVLGVDLDDKIVVMGQGADGSLVSAAYRICGVLDTGVEEIDKGLAVITLRAAQDLFVLGDKVSEFTIRAGDVYKLDKVTAELKKKIDTAAFEVLTWKEISPMLAQTLEFDRAFFDIVLLIVLLVVGSGILNTILMSVLERIREFGIMMALGTKRAQVILMVTLESIFLGLVGTVIGLMLGVFVSLYFGKQGINLSMFGRAFESWYVGSTVWPKLFFRNLWLSSLAVFLISIIVSIYPAWKASKLDPVKAVRHF